MMGKMLCLDWLSDKLSMRGSGCASGPCGLPLWSRVCIAHLGGRGLYGLWGDSWVLYVDSHLRGGRLQLVLMRHPLPPPLSAKTCRGVGRWEGGGGGVLAAWPGGGGGLRATHYYHMHTSRGCLGAWGYRGMYAIIGISCLCQKESLKGLKD